MHRLQQEVSLQQIASRLTLPVIFHLLSADQGCSGAGTRGDGVPHFFSTGERVPHSPHFTASPTFFDKGTRPHSPTFLD